MYHKLVKIPPVPHFMVQPDGYSCGATAVKMALDMLNMDKSIDDLKIMFGTNPTTGTTHEGMIAGFSKLGIPFTRTLNDPTPFATLDRALSLNKLFLMRTAVYGMKHWILVYGKQNDHYLMADPSRGYWMAKEKEIDSIWGCRDYDGFILEQQFDSEIVEIRPIKDTEIKEALEVGFDSFKDIIGGTSKTFYSTVEWSMDSYDTTFVACYRGKIIGGYFLNYSSVSPFYTKYVQIGGNLGIQGVALFTLPQFRGYGVGAALREIPLYLNADYIWGMHLRELNNIDNWERFGRRKVSESKWMYVTLMDLNEKREMLGLKK